MRPSPIDPDQVARLVAAMKRQLGADPARFAETLADAVMEPEHFAPELTALRSPALAEDALIATQRLINEANRRIRAIRRGGLPAKSSDARSDARRIYDTERYRDAVGEERQRLQRVVTGLRAQAGRSITAPNPRQRALERLADKYPREILRFLRDEEAKLARERAAQRTAAREARRSARRDPPGADLSSGPGARPGLPQDQAPPAVASPLTRPENPRRRPAQS